MTGQNETGASKMIRRAGIAGVGLVLVLGVMSCHKAPAQNNAPSTSASDPANGNFAPVDAAGQPAQVLGQNAVNESQQQSEDYTPGQQPPAPIERRAPDNSDAGYGQAGPPPAYDQNNQGYPNNSQSYANDQGYPADQGAPMDDQQAQAVYDADLTDEQASEPPPELPEYDQPPCPDPNYLWTPGYWAWTPGGYYWVPGVWVAAPYVGALWTPGYWGFLGGAYRWHHGFWGPHIGFYGGIDYGYGYVGHGYYGGYWRDNHFFYNTAVNHVNTTVIRNVYVHNVVINNRVVNNQFFNRVSYVGGRGGLQARPLRAEAVVLREQRVGPMQSQLAVRQEAQQNRAQFYRDNHGRPAQTVLARPVAADHTLPAALPRINTPATAYRGNPGADARGRQGRFQNQPNGTDNRGSDNRGQDNRGQGFGAPDQSNGPQQAPPFNQQPSVLSQGRIQRQQPATATNATPQGRPNYQPQNRPADQRPQGPVQNQAQPQAQPQVRQDYQRGGQPQPQYQRGQPQAQPQYQRGQPQAQPQPQPQQRPQYQRQPQPQAQPQPQPQPRQNYQRPQQQVQRPQARQDYQRPQQIQPPPQQHYQPPPQQHYQPAPQPQPRPQPEAHPQPQAPGEHPRP